MHSSIAKVQWFTSWVWFSSLLLGMKVFGDVLLVIVWNCLRSLVERGVIHRCFSTGISLLVIVFFNCFNNDGIGVVRMLLLDLLDMFLKS